MQVALSRGPLKHLIKYPSALTSPVLMSHLGRRRSPSAQCLGARARGADDDARGHRNRNGQPAHGADHHALPSSTPGTASRAAIESPSRGGQIGYAHCSASEGGGGDRSLFELDAPDASRRRDSLRAGGSSRRRALRRASISIGILYLVSSPAGRSRGAAAVRVRGMRAKVRRLKGGSRGALLGCWGRGR